MASTDQDPRIDDLRQRLRSLGYLEAGVDRFVLAPARSTRGPSIIAWLASIRIGSLAAILLGPTAAIGLSARVPGLVTGPRDALFVAIYIGVFFGLVAAGAAFLINLAVALIARRTGTSFARRVPLLSRSAGVLATLACLAYLTLWWQTVIAGVGWSAPVWTASALAIAAAISLVLGHAVTVGSSAVIMASLAGTGGGADAAREMSAPPPRASRLAQWRARIAIGLVAFGGAALLLTWSSRASSASPSASPTLTVVPSGLKILVIAIDGFDVRIFDELSSAGRLPALTGLFRGQVVDLDSGPPDTGDPARVWTTVATGQPPEVHGVRGLVTRRVAGVEGSMPVAEESTWGRALRGATDLIRLTRPSIASGRERRSKTFWEVAASAGLRSLVVNWWATWPVTDDTSTVLTDRATLRLEHGGPLDAEIAPASLYESLRTRWPSLKARAQSMLVDADVLGDQAPAARELLKRSAELDAIQLVLLSESASVMPGVSDLSVVYLPGLDIAQHALLGNDPSSGDQPRVAASTLAERLDAVRRYYDVLDRLIGAVIGQGAMVMLITQPGRVATGAGARLTVVGAGLRAGGRTTARSTDLAPTILYALGVPISRDLAGRPLTDLFTPAFVDRYPVRAVATYGPPAPPSASRSGQPLDQEMIDRLRSLGYVR